MIVRRQTAVISSELQLMRMQAEREIVHYIELALRIINVFAQAERLRAVHVNGGDSILWCYERRKQHTGVKWYCPAEIIQPVKAASGSKRKIDAQIITAHRAEALRCSC